VALATGGGELGTSALVGLAESARGVGVEVGSFGAVSMAPAETLVVSDDFGAPEFK
jgi:hypothetical protein